MLLKFVNYAIYFGLLIYDILCFNLYVLDEMCVSVKLRHVQHKERLI